MKTALIIGLNEFRANKWRNLLFGFIMALAMAGQLIVVMFLSTSKAAMTLHGDESLGRENSYIVSVKQQLESDQLRDLNHRLETLHQQYPWFHVATAFSVNTRMLTSEVQGGPPLRANGWVSLMAVSPSWPQMSLSVPQGELLATVLAEERRGPALMLDTAPWNRKVESWMDPSIPPPPRITAGTLVTLAGDGAVTSPDAALDPTVPEDGSPEDQGMMCNAYGECFDTGAMGGPSGEGGDTGGAGANAVLGEVPVYATYEEANERLRGMPVSYSGITNQNIGELMDLGPVAVKVYFYAPKAQDADGKRLAVSALSAAGLTPQGDMEVLGDRSGFKRQMREMSTIGRWVSLGILVFAVLIVSAMAAGFIEVREPQFATLRTLGASKLGIAVICIMENVITAVIVGVLAITAGVLALRYFPEVFNAFQYSMSETLPIPWGAYLQLAGITILTGVGAGLLPALRAYRAVGN